MTGEQSECEQIVFLICFAESTPDSNTAGNTLKAFIFSLENKERLPPFKCLAKNKRNAIYISSKYGPSFGQLPSLYIILTRLSKAVIGNPYSVPKEVTHRQTVLAGTSYFTPDDYEVFHLS